MGNFISSRLKTAREETGLTQEAFAQELGLSSEYISLLESGKRSPSLDTLSRIAAFLNRDMSFFLREKEPAFTILFRAESLDAPSRAELRRFKQYVEDYLRLEDLTGRRIEPAPLYGNLSAERTAVEERHRLGLGDEPIRDIFGLCERSGLRIFRQSLPADIRISGVFVFIEARDAAFAMINSSQTLCRQIFSAAHEYGHYLVNRHDAPVIDMLDAVPPGGNADRPGGGRSSGKSPKRASKRHPAPTPDSNHPDKYKTNSDRPSSLPPNERFAQEFAAHFLIPPAKVRELVAKDFGGAPDGLSYDDILLIKRYFGVSAQAMLRTLRDLDLLTASRFEDFAARDPVPREREVFGGSAEECWSIAAGATAGSASIIVSDRYRLLERISARGEKNED